VFLKCLNRRTLLAQNLLAQNPVGILLILFLSKRYRCLSQVAVQYNIRPAHKNCAGQQTVQRFVFQLVVWIDRLFALSLYAGIFGENDLASFPVVPALCRRKTWLNLLRIPATERRNYNSRKNHINTWKKPPTPHNGQLRRRRTLSPSTLFGALSTAETAVSKGRRTLFSRRRPRKHLDIFRLLKYMILCQRVAYT